MKAIINGKRYNTSTAILIGTASSNTGHSDFGWWEEVLYKTPRTGAYFLAGEGNARSHYATNLGGGSWGPGSKITPLTKAEAMTWAEQYQMVPVLESEFADGIEDA